MVVRTQGNIVVTGCEQGMIYLWKNFRLIQEFALHSATIRALLISNDRIYSGGMDSTIVVSQLVS